MAVRILYTQHVRSHDQKALSNASNAAGPFYQESPFQNDPRKPASVNHLEKAAPMSTTYSTSSSTASTEVSKAQLSPIVFPQYIATDATTLKIRENGFPDLSDSFTVFQGSEKIFTVRRQRPALGWRQVVTDAKTDDQVMTIQRNIGQLPVSYSFLDPHGARIVDVQGQFSVPFSGSRSSAFLLDARTGEKVELSMQGSHRNRHATISNLATARVLVNMNSDIFEARNVLGGRRTYEVTVVEGMDLAVAVGMVLALDARAD